MYTEKEKVTNNFALEQVKTDKNQSDYGDGGIEQQEEEEAYNVNASNGARLDGIERMMAEQNRMLSEILELLLIQQPEAHREKSMPSRLKKTSFASIKNDENTDTRREGSMVDANRKSSSSSSSSLRKHAIARQQQQIRGDSLQERKAKFALKTVQIEDDKKGLRSSTALAVEAAKRNMMSKQTAAKLQEEERYALFCFFIIMLHEIECIILSFTNYTREEMSVFLSKQIKKMLYSLQ
jgi:hypothetical protein